MTQDVDLVVQLPVAGDVDHRYPAPELGSASFTASLLLVSIDDNYT